MMDVSQINVLYTLNLHNPVCQLYLNKTGRKTKPKQKTKHTAAYGECAMPQVLWKFVVRHLIDSSQESREVKRTIWASIWEDSEMRLGMLSFVGKEPPVKGKGSNCDWAEGAIRP